MHCQLRTGRQGTERRWNPTFCEDRNQSKKQVEKRLSNPKAKSARKYRDERTRKRLRGRVDRSDWCSRQKTALQDNLYNWRRSHPTICRWDTADKCPIPVRYGCGVTRNKKLSIAYGPVAMKQDHSRESCAVAASADEVCKRGRERPPCTRSACGRWGRGGEPGIAVEAA